MAKNRSQPLPVFELAVFFYMRAGGADSLRVPRYLASPRLNATYVMQRSEERDCGPD